jgi:ketosteroid isomerase-like protein
VDSHSRTGWLAWPHYRGQTSSFYLFDRRIFLGLPFTRMPDSVRAFLSPACHRPCKQGLAIAASLVLFASVLPANAGFLKTQKQESRHEIDALEDTWRNAVLTSNTTTLSALLSDDYMAITPSGTLQTKDETLAIVRSGRVHFATIDISDRKVRFYGATAVVTSLANIEASTPDGPVTGSYRYTRVYVRDAQGKWRIVSFEASKVREPGPHKKSELH